MQYAFSMTSRMVTIAVTCAVLLCALLFLLGVEIGVRFAAPGVSAEPAVNVAAPMATTTAVAPAPAQTQQTGTSDVASLPASSSTN
ncbi:hypothetical protein [Paraburkholderia saeva]|uniref:Uncharacterized protein n=1 Tax=Paraburkholderia saeva TaxID=2777537 RepID=A0A9N8RZN8_9BURK|nr:hypothetical protein [Paraburkholderia saeva]CAG4890046.1 hypothetical protein R70241_00894 [Paraburkholderia saeva]CAG4897708.1 hypothetical protein R52603_02346 [Paraburkholderia saeva]CAG4912589.1 hypothetical protein LMG31841_04184 [Paraburkholderia saeva]